MCAGLGQNLIMTLYQCSHPEFLQCYKWWFCFLVTWGQSKYPEIGSCLGQGLYVHEVCLTERAIGKLL